MWFWKYNSPREGGNFHKVQSFSIDSLQKMFGEEATTWTFRVQARCGVIEYTSDLEMSIDDETFICPECKDQEG